MKVLRGQPRKAVAHEVVHLVHQRFAVVLVVPATTVMAGEQGWLRVLHAISCVLPLIPTRVQTDDPTLSAANARGRTNYNVQMTEWSSTP